MITFDDDGIGIPEQVRTRVLDVFHRFRPEAHPRPGIGLPGCRRIAELHGGDLEVSASPLGGTRVSVELPTSTGGAAVPRDAAVAS